MLLSALRGGLDLASAVSGILACLIIIFLVMPLHEFAHAVVAKLCGDRTADMMGRVSFNPIRHIDPMGAALILLVGFGWAKPVPVNPNNMRKPRLHSALVAIAGPLSNLIVSIIASFIYVTIIFSVYSGHIPNSSIIGYIQTFFSYLIVINVSLAVFNILPIPPLDGSKVLYACLPNRLLYKIQPYETYISIGLMFLCITGILSKPLNYLCNAVSNGILDLAINIVSKFF